MRHAARAATALLAVAVAGALVAWGVHGSTPRLDGTDSKEVAGAAPSRVVHLRDWHLVAPKDLFGQDVGLEGAALDDAWGAHLDAVEVVQKEQLRVLRELVARGVKTIYVEGLTQGGVEAWYAPAEVVRGQVADETNGSFRDRSITPTSYPRGDKPPAWFHVPSRIDRGPVYPQAG
jgi:hypothetical protein